MMKALSREDTTLKINSWPQAIVAVTGILAIGGIVVALALAGWDAEAIMGFATLAAALVVGQFVQTRRASVVEAKTDAQTATLQTIERQTNGMSSAERQDIAVRAAQAVLDRQARERRS